jgi:hypothetical protein
MDILDSIFSDQRQKDVLNYVIEYLFNCRMVVEFTTTCAIAYHHLSCEFEPHSWRGVGTPISATKVVTEIFLKVVLNT